MKILKVFCFMGMLLLLASSIGYALTVHPSSSEKARHPSSNTQPSVIKSIHVFKKIDNNVIYLENNQKYSLRGVKVTDFSMRNQISRKKKMAELMFFEGSLKEVILR